MKTYTEILYEVMEDDFHTVKPITEGIRIRVAKAYAKQFLNEAAKRLEVYDDERGLLSQIAYKIMDEIDAQ